MTINNLKGQLVFIISLSISIVIFNSCCTEKYCLGADDLDNISFYDFSQQKLDTIILKKFEKNSNFHEMIDSIFSTPEYFTSSADYEMVFFQEKFDTGQSYTLTNFVV